MSHGPGKVERTIAELFVASADTIQTEDGYAWGGDRSFTVDELCKAVFGFAAEPTLAQRGSVIRAAHRVIKRTFESREKEFAVRTAWEKAHASLLEWRATALPHRRIVFHHVSRPVHVWAVHIQPEGLVWAEAKIRSITRRRVNVVYEGEKASLDRGKIRLYGAWWRGVLFVSERDGLAAWNLNGQWQEKYGRLHVGLMPLEEARRLLDVPEAYTRADIVAGFRRAAKRCHPDLGGTAEQFRELVEARDRLLASLGMRAAAPKPPAFYPAGVKVVYRRRASPRAPRISNVGRRIKG
jgi:hypothetical protein